MPSISGRTPPGPAEKFNSADDLLTWMRTHFETYGDIYKASVYGGDVFVVSSPEFAEHILLKNWRNYLRKGQAVKRIALSLGNGLISSNGEMWASQRRMIQPAFKSEAIAAFYEIFVDASRALLDKWRLAAKARAEVDVTRDISLTVLEATLRSIFGADYEKVAQYFAVIAEESRDLGFAQTCNALAKIIIKIAEARRDARIDASDILGIMMRAHDRKSGQAMPDTQLAREAMTLVIAGHETTASVLNWIWYLLAICPEIDARLFSELETTANGAPRYEALDSFAYVRQVIEEALRSYPPLWLMTRKAVADDMLGEYLIPARTEIFISPYLVQRNPAFWHQPDRIDPDRFGPERSTSDGADSHRLAMCPFGAGPRNCIGEDFARVEMQAHLLVIAKQLRLRYDGPRPAEFVAGVNLLSRYHFMMRPELREPSARAS